MNTRSVSNYLRRAATIARHPSNRGHWVDLARRVLMLRWALATQRTLEFPFLNGTRFRCWPETNVSRDLAYYRVPDHAQMAFLLAYLRSADNVLDVGANVGIYTVLSASMVGATGHVDAVEAVPVTASRLRENIALNGVSDRVTVHEVAVGAQADWAWMTTDYDATNHLLPAGQAEGSSRIGVRATHLDDIAQRPEYAFGKIDIEGREWDALRGASRLFTQTSPPIWQVEINGALFRYGHEVASFVAWMAQQGFDPYAYDPRAGVLRPTDSVWDDVLFVARHRIASIQERLQRRAR